jgi:hypothetical protein
VKGDLSCPSRLNSDVIVEWSEEEEEEEERKGGGAGRRGGSYREK